MHSLKCQCGAVQGQVLDGTPNNRVRCFCADCQAFGRFFGPSASVLDEHGGTEIIQVCQSRLRFDRGLEHLTSIRLTDKGLIRWYTACCKTPVGNTMADPRLSFVGLIHTILDPSALDRDFGPSIARVNTNSALGEPKPSQHGLAGAIFRLVVLIVTARIHGRYKQSPLFTAAGTPIAPSRILTAAELQHLRESPHSG